MARRAKYTFGGLSFTSQDGVKRHGAAIRSRYAQGETISDAADVAFLTDLLDCHVDRAQKIGVGVRRFYYDTAPDHPNAVCFFVERVDGKHTDFGVPACLTGIRQLNLQSLRMAVRSEIERFRVNQLQGRSTFGSAFSGKEFPAGECAVDHVVPFDTIVADFCSAQNIDLDAQLLTKSTDLRSDAVWISDATRAAFVEHHARFELRLVHWRENNSEIVRINNAGLRQVSSGSDAPTDTRRH